MGAYSMKTLLMPHVTEIVADNNFISGTLVNIILSYGAWNVVVTM